MALMFPATIPAEIARDPKRKAEISVYERLRRQLGDEFHVFYSSPWLGTRPDGSEVDGEADFLVAHEVLGLLAIEVKGGGIRIDSDNNWTSTDRFGIERRIRNPVQQARASKHQLIEKLRKSDKWRPRFIRARHGVILPDVERPSNDMRPDMPLHLFAFANDMRHLDAWVRSRFRSAEETESSEKVAHLGADGLTAIDDLLAGPIRLLVKLRTTIDETVRDISLRTADQVWVLRELEDHRRMKVVGAAGTGKTILAVEKSLMLAREGLRTLLLCYNRPLSLHLASLVVGEPLITCSGFDAFARKVADQAGVAVGGKSTEELADALIDNFVEAGMEEFDAVVIDEGQDFRDGWLRSLEAVVRDAANGTLYVFYDDNQNVTGSSAGYIVGLPSAERRLGMNLRNTKAIFKEANKYYRGGFVRPVGPDGVDVLWHSWNEENPATQLSKRLGTLIKTEGITPGDIAILLPTASDVETFRSDGKIRVGKYEASNAETRRPDRIVVDSIRRFKGLESPVVLLLVNGAIQDNDEVLYTGMTRAQVLLEVFGPSHMIDCLRLGDNRNHH